MRTASDSVPGAGRSSGDLKSLIVVLGMHRSGTSAVTRGLEVLGVDLGTRLMPAEPDNNDKGFFEDVEINAINLDLYRSLGAGQSWHTLALVPERELVDARHGELRKRAVNVLRSRLRETDSFGLKDPALCRLLAFWQDVFREIRAAVRYVIVVRNPLSVARSLEKRDGLPAEKCHYLWLQHVLSSVSGTQSAPRVVVDYDRLIDDPGPQLERIARVLELEDRVDGARLAEFCGSFLEPRMRHARFDGDALAADPRVPEPVRAAYALLADVAGDRASLDSEAARATIARLAGEMRGMAPAMAYLARLDNTVADRDGDIDRLNATLVAVLQSDQRQRRMRSSLEWRLLAPARLMRKRLQDLGGRIAVDLIPLGGLRAEGPEWIAANEHPRLLLVPERDWDALEGWCWLEIASAAGPAVGRVLFDVGAGFDASRALRFQLPADGVRRVPLYVPACRAALLDLVGAPARFRLSARGIRKSRRALSLPPDLRDQSPVYEALARREPATAGH